MMLVDDGKQVLRSLMSTLTQLEYSGALRNGSIKIFVMESMQTFHYIMQTDFLHRANFLQNPLSETF